MGKKQNNGSQNQDGEGKKAHKNIENIILQVYIHCDGCAVKISHCLQGFDGVEEIIVDRANNKVVVKGERADPSKILTRVQKKFSTSAQLISPKPKPNNNDQDRKQQPQQKQAQLKVVVLKMFMHCEGCARDIQKNVARIDGVLSVETDMSKSQVTVKGEFDPPKLVEKITKRLGKFVEIVKEEALENKKKNNKKDNENNNNNMIHFPHQQHPINNNFYSCLSDESLHSCSVM